MWITLYVAHISYTLDPLNITTPYINYYGLLAVTDITRRHKLRTERIFFRFNWTRNGSYGLQFTFKFITLMFLR